MVPGDNAELNPLVSCGSCWWVSRSVVSDVTCENSKALAEKSKVLERVPVCGCSLGPGPATGDALVLLPGLAEGVSDADDPFRASCLARFLITSDFMADGRRSPWSFRLNRNINEDVPSSVINDNALQSTAVIQYQRLQTNLARKNRNTHALHNVLPLSSLRHNGVAVVWQL